MASDGWVRTTLESIAADTPNALATGPFGSAISSKYFQDHGVPVIRGSNLSERVGVRLIEDGLVFVSEEKARSFARSIARRGDLVFTCWGTIGQIGLIDSRATYEEYVVSNKQMKLTPDPERIDSLFLYYLLSSAEMMDQVTNQAIGSSVPGFNLGQLRKLTLFLPPLPEQRRIAHILGTLDDKIELNRRTNRVLEEMARAVFRAWFVDFAPVKAKVAGATGFPGMPQEVFDQLPDRFVESELGPIPEGWGVGKLGLVMDHPRRSVSPSEMTDDTVYIGLEHMPRQSIALTEWGSVGSVTSGKHRFAKGEYLFGKLRPYFHKVGIAPVDGVCSTDIVVIRPRTPAWNGFVLGHISSSQLVEYTSCASTGTRMPRTSWKDMVRYGVVLPPVGMAEAYSQLIEPMMENIIALVHQSRALSALRDALLPKLVSGELPTQRPFRQEELV